ncbi:SPFH domain-containing protein [Saccharomonospora sp. NPDC006951]
MATIVDHPQTPTLAQASVNADPTFGWVVGAGLLTVSVCLSMLRVVPSGQRLVLSRFGNVVAVKGPGIVVVVPILHRSVRVPLGPSHIELRFAEAETEDGITVTVTAGLVTTVTDPVAYVRSPEGPPGATAKAAEAETARYVARHTLTELADTADKEDLRPLAEHISAITSAWGTEVDQLTFSRIEVTLGAELVHWARRSADPGASPSRTAPPDSGTLRRCVTRGGQHLGVLQSGSGQRRLLVYGSPELDVPPQTIVLEPDEADKIADILHSQPIADRLAALENRVDKLTEEAS